MNVGEFTATIAIAIIYVLLAVQLISPCAKNARTNYFTLLHMKTMHPMKTFLCGLALIIQVLS